MNGFDKDTFVYDWKTRSAVLYQLTVVGEAVKRLSKEFRAEYPQIPWPLIAGMRASIYNAMDLAGTQELVKFMKEFQKKNG